MTAFLTMDYAIKMLEVVMPPQKNSGKYIQETGLAPPKVTCVSVAGSKDLKLIIREQQGAWFPF